MENSPNERKSVHVTLALRKKDAHYCVSVNRTQIPQAETIRYLGLHLDS